MRKSVGSIGENGRLINGEDDQQPPMFKTIGCSSTIMTINCKWSWLLVITYHYDHLLIGTTSIIDDKIGRCWSRCSSYESNVQSYRSPTIKMTSHRRLIIDGQDNPKPTIKMIWSWRIRRPVIVTVYWSWSWLTFVANNHQLSLISGWSEIFSKTYDIQ